jgi:uncharacterized protein YjbJ (UPF0337 family)
MRRELDQCPGAGVGQNKFIEKLSGVRPPWAVLLVENKIMDKDRIEGSAKEIKGKIKELAGKVLGDVKLESEGKADQAAGKVQNAAGGLKDYLKRR